jgi:hypothetical protein
MSARRKERKKAAKVDMGSRRRFIDARDGIAVRLSLQARALPNKALEAS